MHIRIVKASVCTMTLVGVLVLILYVNSLKSHGIQIGRNPWVQQQHQRWNSRNPTIVIINNNHHIGCAYPIFTDTVTFLIDKCGEGQRSSRHPVCRGGNVKVPVGWEGNMLCRTRSISVKFESVCSKYGEWNPPLFHSCVELLRESVKTFPEADPSSAHESFQANGKQELLQEEAERQPANAEDAEDQPGALPAKSNANQSVHLAHPGVPHPDLFVTEGSEDELPCVKLKVPKDDRFVFTCIFPNSTEVVLDCGTESAVESRTRAVLDCKSPHTSRNGKPNSWLCHNGKWSGKSNELYCILRPQFTSHASADPKSPPARYPTTSNPLYWDQTGDAFDTSLASPTTTEATTTMKTTTAPITTTETLTTAMPKTTTTKLARTSATPAMVVTTQRNFPPINVTPAPVLVWTPNIDITKEQISFTDYEHPLIDIRTTESTGLNIMCPPLLRKTPGVQIDCTNRQRKRNGEVIQGKCDFPVPVGSEARYSCKPYYETTAGLTTLFRKCKADGTWTGSSDQFACIVQCGRSSTVRTPYITHGFTSVRGQWPWNAALLIAEKTVQRTEWQFICGGSLISHTAILTAAHCVTYLETTTNRNKDSLRVDLGKYQRERIDELVQSRSIQEILVHPSYNPYNFDSDIALLILKSPVNISHHVQPVCFPQTSDSAIEEFHLSENSVGTVVGWGKDENGKLADKLQTTSLPVVSQRKCVDNLGLTTQLQTRSTTFCAGFNNGTNVCSGDSGAGMVFPSKNTDHTRWYLQGIVSVGLPDEGGQCDPTKYSVFTRVGRYADWIVRKLTEQDKR